MSELKLEVLLAALDRASGPLKGLAAQSKATGAALRAAQSELKALDAAGRQLRGFESQTKALEALDRKMDDTRRTAAYLREQMAGTKGADRKGFAKEIEQSKRALVRMGEQSNKLRAQLAQTRAALESAGLSTKDMAAAESELARRTAAATGALREQQSALGRLAQRQRAQRARGERLSAGMGRGAALSSAGAGAIASGVGIGLPLAAVARDAAELQSVLVDVGITADADAGRIARIGAALPGMARAANQFQQDLAVGMQQLVAKGLDLDIAERAILPVGQAATGAKASLEDVQETAAALIQNLKLAVSDLPRALDTLTAAGNAGAFELRDMAAELPALTAAYQNLGPVGLKATSQLAAGLQIARRGAATASTAANNMLNYILKLTAPETVKNFKKMGVDLEAQFKTWQKKGLDPLIESARLLQRMTGGDSFKIGELFGDMQVKAFIAPFLQGIDDYQKIRDEAGAAVGASQAQFARRMAEDPLERLKAAQIKLTEAGIKLGVLLIPVFEQIASVIERVVDAVSRWASEHPELAATLAKVAGWVAVLSIAGGALMLVLGGLLGPIAMVVFALGAIGPVGAIVLAVVAAIAAAAAWISTNWGQLGPKFQSLWASIVGIHRAAVAQIIAAVLGGLSNLAGQMVAVGARIIDGLRTGIASRVAALRSYVAAVGADISAWFSAKLGIRSPSRVFAAHGMAIAAGLAVGIAEGAPLAMRQLDAMSREIAAGGDSGYAALSADRYRPLAGSGPATVHQGGDTIAINLTAPPGTDGRALAEQIERILRDRDRAKTASARSALYDLD